MSEDRVDLSKAVAAKHLVTGNTMHAPFPENMETAVFGMGCFWGVERVFWQIEGVYSTQVGYTEGHTVNPTYKEICNKDSGHAEVVRVIYDPAVVTYKQLLTLFWEKHNPTQGMRQGNDMGSQYRSMIMFYSADQEQLAKQTKATYQQALTAAGHNQDITTEIVAASNFYYAEDYHQQYLAKNPNGYCGLKGTGACLI